MLQNSYMFMKNIRGTVAYFRNALYDLLDMFRSLGPPTLFMTLSADDLHWPELFWKIHHMMMLYVKVRLHPVCALILFSQQFILKEDFLPLFKFVICGESHPFGKV